MKNTNWHQFIDRILQIEGSKEKSYKSVQKKNGLPKSFNKFDLLHSNSLDKKYKKKSAKFDDM